MKPNILITLLVNKFIYEEKDILHSRKIPKTDRIDSHKQCMVD
jgi:hypothetical protein